MPPVDARLHNVEERIQRLETRMQRVDHVMVTMSRCLKTIWVVLAPVVAGLLLKYLGQ